MNEARRVGSHAEGMELMSEELKPCPFCGGEAVLREAYTPPDFGWASNCGDCDALGPATATENAAIAAWNTRAPAPEMAEALEGLLECIIVHEGADGRRSWWLNANTPTRYDTARAALAKARGR